MSNQDGMSLRTIWNLQHHARIHARNMRYEEKGTFEMLKFAILVQIIAEKILAPCNTPTDIRKEAKSLIAETIQVMDEDKNLMANTAKVIEEANKAIEKAYKVIESAQETIANAHKMSKNAKETIANAYKVIENEDKTIVNADKEIKRAERIQNAYRRTGSSNHYTAEEENSR